MSSDNAFHHPSSHAARHAGPRSADSASAVFATPEGLHETAMRIIERLEQRFESEFGCKVNVGAELEFSILPKDPEAFLKSGRTDNPLQLSDWRKGAGHWPLSAGYAPSSGQLPNYPNPFQIFGKSPTITHIYKEVKPFVYEVVLSHQAQDLSTPSGIVDAIDMAKHDIRTKLVAAIARQGYPEMNQVSFEATTGINTVIADVMAKHPGTVHPAIADALDKPAIHPLQFNISLVRNDNPHRAPLDDFRSHLSLAHAQLPVIREGISLLCPNERSYPWLHARTVNANDSDPIRSKSFTADYEKQGTHLAIQQHGYNPRYPVYFEYRLSSMDTDPALALAVNLMALYHGLKQHHFDRTIKGEQVTPPSIGPLPDDQQPTPRTKADALDILQTAVDRKESLIQSIGNDLEPGLGDRFVHSTLRCLRAQDLNTPAGASTPPLP